MHPVPTLNQSRTGAQSNQAFSWPLFLLITPSPAAPTPSDPVPGIRVSRAVAGSLIDRFESIQSPAWQTDDHGVDRSMITTTGLQKAVATGSMAGDSDHWPKRTVSVDFSYSLFHQTITSQQDTKLKRRRTQVGMSNSSVRIVTFKQRFRFGKRALTASLSSKKSRSSGGRWDSK